jgi:hypothetical protein
VYREAEGYWVADDGEGQRQQRDRRGDGKYLCRWGVDPAETNVKSDDQNKPGD